MVLTPENCEPTTNHKGSLHGIATANFVSEAAVQQFKEQP